MTEASAPKTICSSIEASALLAMRFRFVSWLLTRTSMRLPAIASMTRTLTRTTPFCGERVVILSGLLGGGIFG